MSVLSMFALIQVSDGRRPCIDASYSDEDCLSQVSDVYGLLDDDEPLKMNSIWVQMEKRSIYGLTFVKTVKCYKEKCRKNRCIQMTK